ncbi:hypothetical protein [Nibrella viscosa]|uniref:hypothetical protein n=1 Tax=Nibrella viscosa TaxID=1084524 RepID=UPI0031EBAA73
MAPQISIQFLLLPALVANGYGKKLDLQHSKIRLPSAVSIKVRSTATASAGPQSRLNELPLAQQDRPDACY